MMTGLKHGDVIIVFANLISEIPPLQFRESNQLKDPTKLHFNIVLTNRFLLACSCVTSVVNTTLLMLAEQESQARRTSDQSSEHEFMLWESFRIFALQD